MVVERWCALLVVWNILFVKCGLIVQPWKNIAFRLQHNKCILNSFVRRTLFIKLSANILCIFKQYASRSCTIVHLLFKISIFMQPHYFCISKSSFWTQAFDFQSIFQWLHIVLQHMFRLICIDLAKNYKHSAAFFLFNFSHLHHSFPSLFQDFYCFALVDGILILCTYWLIVTISSIHNFIAKGTIRRCESWINLWFSGMPNPIRVRISMGGGWKSMEISRNW